MADPTILKQPRCGWCERPCWSRVSGRRIHPHCNVRRLEAVHDRTGSAREKQSRDAAPAAAAPAAAAAAASVTGAATATATVAAAASASPARTEPCVAAASGLLSLSSPAPWPLPAIAAPHATAATAATAAAAGGLAVATPAEAASGEPEESEYQREARRRQLPAHVVHARQCLQSHGSAFVPRFGVEFGREYVRGMAPWIHSRRLTPELKQTIAGDVTQVLMPPDPPPAADEHIEAEEALAEAAAGAAAGASPARVGSKRKQPSGRKATRKKKTATGKADASSPSKGATDRLAWDTLKPKWHALVKKLAQYLGFTPEKMEVYRVQDSKLLIAKFGRGEQGVHCDRDDVKERTSVVYTVILYLCEGADSTAFPKYPLADFAIPDFISADSTEVRNAEAMKESIRLGLLEPEQYERWPVQFGDMAFFTQVTLHFGTQNRGAAERWALFSVYTPFADERQDDYQIYRWMYVDFAYGTESRELAQAVYRDHAKFKPLDRIRADDKVSYRAYVRSLLRWNVAAFHLMAAAPSSRLQMRKASEHIPEGGDPLEDKTFEKYLPPLPAQTDSDSDGSRTP